jgi:ubiquitin carboxyl-terminal hydrolase 9/24
VNDLEKKLSQCQLCMLNEDYLDFHLFYFKDDQTQRMPLPVQRSVRKQNIKFLHNKILFSLECFSFIKRLIQSNVQQLLHILQQQQLHEDQTVFTNVNFDKPINPNELFFSSFVDHRRISFNLCSNCNEISLFNRMAYEESTPVCTNEINVNTLLMIFFLFSGPASDWSELISHCIRCSRKARAYLAEEVLFKHQNRFQEYLIDCTSPEVRQKKFIIFFETIS